MTWLIIGIVLWYGAHFFKRIAPAARARMGDKGKGLMALIILASVVLMVIGYRTGDFDYVYAPLPGMGHLVNLTMIASIFLFGAGDASGVTRTRVRHPMLTGMLIWSLSHLLVNGDSAAIVLFGSMALWSLLEIIVINRAEGPWTPPERRPASKDLKLLVITLVIYAIITGIHWWLGYNPFLGTYG
ncbi:NnrU family protein [Aliiroseovarius subalbicans]|uniref:NnrU family protein n=1 Tax=Aliiroseovarius subalbicans TaxID=2925840 RepID=UPI001F5ABE7B|nr:NnrU family protein [Aliiroseovarius subalbicans]MCI2400658.1 NnrU family protein [Aliiroseovarius subalbicans]